MIRFWIDYYFKYNLFKLCPCSMITEKMAYHCFSNTTSYIRLATAEGLLVSDLLLEAFVLLFVLPCISYLSIGVMTKSCNDLNFWCSRIHDLGSSHDDGQMSSSIGTILISRLDLLAIWRKRNSWKWLVQITMIIFFVCCIFYVTYGRTPGRLVLDDSYIA